MDETRFQIMRAGVRQLLAEAESHKRIWQSNVATQLVREALEAFTDDGSPVDLRDWVKAAQAYIREVDHA